MNVDFGTAIRLYFANYINFSGRSTRAEYWFAMLFVFIVSLVVGFFKSDLLSSLVSLAFILPSLAIAVRRFHDTGRSGWLLLGLYVLEIVGAVIMMLGGASAIVMMGHNPDPSAVIDIIKSHSLALGIGMLVALVGSVWMLVITLLPSGKDNVYGPDPYGE